MSSRSKRVLDALVLALDYYNGSAGVEGPALHLGAVEDLEEVDATRAHARVKEGLGTFDVILKVGAEALQKVGHSIALLLRVHVRLQHGE